MKRAVTTPGSEQVLLVHGTKGTPRSYFDEGRRDPLAEALRTTETSLVETIGHPRQKRQLKRIEDAARLGALSATDPKTQALATRGLSLWGVALIIALVTSVCAAAALISGGGL